MKQKCSNGKCPHGNFDPYALKPCEKCLQDAIRIVSDVWAEKLERERTYKKHKGNGHEERREE